MSCSVLLTVGHLCLHCSSTSRGKICFPILLILNLRKMCKLKIQLASLINQLQNTNSMFNTEAHAEADKSLARNEILTDNKIIRTVTEEDDDDDDDVTPANPVKISHSEAVAALNTSLQWAEEQNF
ncbi:hypothetical protein AVEN_44256-1 [Araneus ventricosus]|uniref:Uncharacterized protein n=1 Tax=Araneus ventricosus TaxID=182803 RepID=A0A4Y2P439_ARAVE|nr:hypothetical protein AVEN_44256-1 [Araneus ventricosus]